MTESTTAPKISLETRLASKEIQAAMKQHMCNAVLSNRLQCQNIDWAAGGYPTLPVEPVMYVFGPVVHEYMDEQGNYVISKTNQFYRVDEQASRIAR